MCQQNNTGHHGHGGEAPLPQSSNGSRGVEDDLSSIHAVHEPIEWMMTAVANIHSNLPKLCLEHCVASVALHVICRLSRKHKTIRTAVFQFLHSHTGSFRSSTHLIKVPDPGNVVLPALSQHVSRVGDDHRRVPQGAV